MKRCYLTLIVLVLFISHASAATNSPQRFDLSPKNDRKDHLVADGANWLVDASGPAKFDADGIGFTIEPTGDGAAMKSDWWKAGLVHDALLASDGVFVEGDGAGLRLTIRGLTPGKHSLVTYHNSLWDKDVRLNDVLINGKPAVTAIAPSRRVINDVDCTSAFAEFEATAGEPVVVEFRPHATKQGDNDRLARVIVNGFELDTVDPTKKALKPSPANRDEHAPENPTLTWRPAKSATSHDVYLGTDAAAVAAATPKSPEYRGRQSGNEFKADVADNFANYYWRVDTIQNGASEKDNITKGDVWSFRTRHLAFPEAEGYGRFARGGRGGRVIKVTNLNDAGPGSLRAAIEADGPHTVVFDVSGRIDLKNRMGVRNPYLTIAGQTAPGKGICISNLNLGMLGTHDVIIRHIRVRPGDTSGLTLDGMGMASTDHSIIDHCSISWTHDEAFSSRGAKNITLQRTLISEALNVAGHKNYEKGKEHGYAASIGGDVGSFHHNLLAHCAGRNWSLAGGLDKAGRHTARLDIRNNVVYNWGHRTTDGGAYQVNFVNNYYKPGPSSRVFHVLMPERHLVQAFGPQDYFVEGNVMEGRYDASEPLAGVTAERGYKVTFIADKPFFESYVTTQTADEAYDDVLADVGCNVPALDDHDRRVIEETRNGTTTYKGSVSGLEGLPDSQKDVGGWEDYPEEHRAADYDPDNDGIPTAWEKEHNLNPEDPADANADPNKDGYTNLEEFLNELATRRN